jgi:glyoxylase-like metal-dependent hydrolase (beta-lactamase superfamily II)
MTRTIRILAPNPGPFTLEGTNTWVLGPGPSLVVDPGPDDPAHLERVAEAAGGVIAIILTHPHPDHAPGAPALARSTGARVLAFDPSPGEHALPDGSVVEGGGFRLRVMHTPGHTPDHVVLHDLQSDAMFTGDAVLGRGTSVIDPPDGDLAAYLRSIRAMLAIGPPVLYPGHGPVVWDGRARLREYLRHREERERQVLAGLAAGPRSPADLVPTIYADHDPVLHGPAARSVLAHLLKLEAEGRVRRVGPPGGDVFELSV